MKYSEDLIKALPNGDIHLTLVNVEYSTNIREIVTVGYMIEHPIIEEGEKMSSVTKKCWKCETQFKVPENEHSDHDCPNGCKEASGIDYFGNEYFKGDAIVIDVERGETVLEDSLEDYLIEVKGFKFENAK